MVTWTASDAMRKVQTGVTPTGVVTPRQEWYADYTYDQMLRVLQAEIDRASKAGFLYRIIKVSPGYAVVQGGLKGQTGIGGVKWWTVIMIHGALSGQGVFVTWG